MHNSGKIPEKSDALVHKTKMKCEICKGNITPTFLEKPKGTYVKDAKGKKHLVCFECQKKFTTKQEILKNLQ